MKHNVNEITILNVYIFFIIIELSYPVAISTENMKFFERRIKCWKIAQNPNKWNLVQFCPAFWNESTILAWLIASFQWFSASVWGGFFPDAYCKMCSLIKSMTSTLLQRILYALLIVWPQKCVSQCKLYVVVAANIPSLLRTISE